MRRGQKRDEVTLFFATGEEPGTQMVVEALDQEEFWWSTVGLLKLMIVGVIRVSEATP